MDRPGSDLSFVDLLNGPNAAECQQKCENTAACKAWTLAIRPTGTFGGASVNRCFLKSAIPAPTVGYGMFSGIKGGYLF